MRIVSHFPYLTSLEAAKTDGLWGWAKRLVDALNRWKLFELMDLPLSDKPLQIIRVNVDGTGFEYAPEELGLTDVDLAGKAKFIIRVNDTEDGYILAADVMSSLIGVSLVGKAGYTLKVKADETGFELVP